MAVPLALVGAPILGMAHIETYASHPRAKLILYRLLLKNLTWSEMEEAFNHRILVLGLGLMEYESFVDWLTGNNLNAYGLAPFLTISDRYAVGNYSQWPFAPQVFSLVLGLDFIDYLNRFDFADRGRRLVLYNEIAKQMYRTMVPRGFAVIGQGWNEEFEAMMKHVGFIRLPFTFEDAAIYYKSQRFGRRDRPNRHQRKIRVQVMRDMKAAA